MLLLLWVNKNNIDAEIHFNKEIGEGMKIVLTTYHPTI